MNLERCALAVKAKDLISHWIKQVGKRELLSQSSNQKLAGFFRILDNFGIREDDIWLLKTVLILVNEDIEAVLSNVFYL